MLYPSELLAHSGRASTVADGAKRGTSTKQLYSIPDMYASGMIRTARGRFAVTSMRTFPLPTVNPLGISPALVRQADSPPGFQ